MLSCLGRVSGVVGRLRHTGVRAVSSVRLQDYTPPLVDVHALSLHFDVKDVDGRDVELKTSFSVSRSAHTEAQALVLDGDPETVELVSVEANGAPLAYDLQNDGTQLSIPLSSLFPSDAGADDAASTISITTRLVPRKNTALMGLYKSSGGLFTQCEAEGFRRMTYFLDRPDVLTTYTTTIAAPTDLPVLLSNGNQTHYGPDPSDPSRHIATFHDPFPKPSYLFAVICADLDVLSDTFVTQSGRSVDLHIYAKAQDIAKCGAAMDALKASMKWDEDRFGLEYDLDAYSMVAVDDFNMGAMENKGLNVFNTKYILAHPDTSTDADYDGVARVVAHEYCHNWTGNRVTCRDWFQLSLKEGLTVFRDAEFGADHGSRAVERIKGVVTLRSVQFAEDRSAMAHPVRPETYQRIDNFYSTTIYEKGAEVVRQLETILGVAGFRAGMDLYFQRHDGQAVTCEDFVSAMVDANRGANPVVDRDGLAQFLRWYNQAGTPTVTSSYDYDADAGTVALTLSQSNPPIGPYEDKAAAKPPLHIPVKFGLLGPDGASLAPAVVDGLTSPAGDDGDSAVLHLTEPSQTFVIGAPKGLSEPPTLSLLRGFSAPVRLVQHEHDPHRDLHRLRHDTDPFVRWEASHRIATDVVSNVYDSMTAADGDGGVTAASAVTQLSDALQLILETESATDPAWTALCLGLPSVEELLGGAIDRHGSGDPLVMDAARSAVRRSLSVGLEDTLGGLYTSLTHTCTAHAASLSKTAKANRSLRNAVLSLLTEPHKPCHAGASASSHGVDAPSLILAQFQTAQNMTDTQAAMMLAASLSPSHAVFDAVIGPYYDAWKDEPLVLDAWFRAQSLTGTASEVEALLAHPSFTYANPNRVYAGVVPFAFSNPSAFHEETGKGYAVLADAVSVLNQSNPPVAARLAKAFGRSAQLSAPFKTRVGECLDPLLAGGGLKPEVEEVVVNARKALEEV